MGEGLYSISKGLVLVLASYQYLFIVLQLSSSWHFSDIREFHVQCYAMEQDELLPMVQSKNLTFSFSSESSIEEELKRESTADVITILVGVFLYHGFNT